MTMFPNRNETANTTRVFTGAAADAYEAGKADGADPDVGLPLPPALMKRILEAAAPWIAKQAQAQAVQDAINGERKRVWRDLIEGDPGKLEAAFREFVDPEEAADCALAVADLLRDES